MCGHESQPEWLDSFDAADLTALHWHSVGPPDASDQCVLGWARLNHHFVLTQDLDFPGLLHTTRAAGPRVVLLRLDDEQALDLRAQVVRVIREHRRELELGCLLVVDQRRARVRMLPSQRGSAEA